MAVRHVHPGADAEIPRDSKEGLLRKTIKELELAACPGILQSPQGEPCDRRIVCSDCDMCGASRNSVDNIQESFASIGFIVAGAWPLSFDHPYPQAELNCFCGIVQAPAPASGQCTAQVR